MTHQTSSINPDIADFVHGFINRRNDGLSGSRVARRSQGEGGMSGSRTARRSQGEGGLGSSILSAYFASLIAGADNSNGTRTAPRVIRIGGNDNDEPVGPGLDIHIHAIVSGPGGGAFGFPDLLNSFGNGTNQANSNSENANVESLNQAMEEEDTEQFHNLYSEQPTTDAIDSELLRSDEVEIEDESDNDADSRRSESIDEATLPLLEPSTGTSSISDGVRNEEPTESLLVPGGNIESGTSELEYLLELESEINNHNSIPSRHEHVTVSSGDVTIPNPEMQDNTDNNSEPECLSELGSDANIQSTIPATHEHNTVNSCDVATISYEEQDNTYNTLTSTGFLSDSINCDASCEDDESVHTAHECAEDFESRQDIRDIADSKPSSTAPDADVTSFIVDSKDGEDLEVCLGHAGHHGDLGALSSIVTSIEDYRQENNGNGVNRLEDDEDDRNGEKCHAESSNVAILSPHGDKPNIIVDNEQSNDQGRASDKDESSDGAAESTPKSLIARLLRRKH
jgi:hypothetical protein